MKLRRSNFNLHVNHEINYVFILFCNVVFNFSVDIVNHVVVIERL